MPKENAFQSWVICPQCQHVQASKLGKKIVRCRHCGWRAHRNDEPWLDWSTALTLASVVLFIGAHVLTFFSLSIGAQSQAITILSGAGSLLAREQWLLASLVLLTTFILPLFEILTLSYLLMGYRFNKRWPIQTSLMRWLTWLQHWIMHDVFLLGVLVTTVKLGDKAEVNVGPALVLFFLLVLSLQAAYWRMDSGRIWSWLRPQNGFGYTDDEALYHCQTCQAKVGALIIQRRGHCPRCGDKITQRIPQSLQKTVALLLAAAILSVPANLFIIMDYDELGVSYDSTILAGVLELFHNGLWFVAAIVFVASIVVPFTKLMLLSYLTWSAHRHQSQRLEWREKMYRFTKLIGRWSMVDVYVVTLLTAAVQFEFIGRVEPGAALLPFAGVVILTMLAVETFDVRIMFDRAYPHQSREQSIKQLQAALPLKLQEDLT